MSTSTISSVIKVVQYVPETEQIKIEFHSKPNHSYLYNVAPNQFSNVQQQFMSTDSLGKTYWQLLTEKIISPVID